MSKRNLLLLSASSVHGYEYLQYAAKDIKEFLQSKNVSRILFIPYALSNHDAYHEKVMKVFKEWSIPVDSIHKFKVAKDAVQNAQGIFIGGGNTFLLLKKLYENNIIKCIQERVLNDGIPYIGTSAGTNVATVNICTTNDMPIVFPSSFEALNLVPFNINPHFLDGKEAEKHKGETREERILQYLEVGPMKYVLAMREGCTLSVNGNKAVLKGVSTARLYTKNSESQDLELEADVSFLLSDCQ